jgi:hypothetical protein
VAKKRDGWLSRGMGGYEVGWVAKKRDGWLRSRMDGKKWDGSLKRWIGGQVGPGAAKSLARLLGTAALW